MSKQLYPKIRGLGNKLNFEDTYFLRRNKALTDNYIVTL